MCEEVLPRHNIVISNRYLLVSLLLGLFYDMILWNIYLLKSFNTVANTAVLSASNFTRLVFDALPA